MEMKRTKKWYLSNQTTLRGKVLTSQVGWKFAFFWCRESQLDVNIIFAKKSNYHRSKYDNLTVTELTCQWIYLIKYW